MVVINGAGIAGLTLANALQQKNIPFVVLEQAPEHRALGAGIAVQNNGLAILKRLGLMHLLSASAVKQIAIGQLGQVQSAALFDVGLDCNVVHRQQLQEALLANLPQSCIRLNTSIAEFQVSSTDVSVLLNDNTRLNGRYLVNAAGINSDLHAPAELRKTQLWCWRTVVKLNKPITCFGEYWFGQQRLGISPINEQLGYVFHVVKLKPTQSADSFSTAMREQWIGRQSELIKDVESLRFIGQTWLSHPLQDRKINWGNGRLVAIGDAAHAMTPNLGQGAVLAMEDAMELASLIANEHSNLAHELACIRHKRVARMHRLSYWMGTIAHVDNVIAVRLKTAFFKRLPIQSGLKSQVKWMNQFTHRLKEI